VPDQRVIENISHSLQNTGRSMPIIADDIPHVASLIAVNLERAGLLAPLSAPTPAPMPALRTGARPAPPTAAKLGDMPQFASAKEASDFAISIAEDAEYTVKDKPQGQDFLADVARKCREVSQSILTHNSVTDRQTKALLNWRSGVNGWMN